MTEQQEQTKMERMKKEILKIIRGAKAIVIGRRQKEGGEKITIWQTVYDKYSINTNFPIFRTLRGRDHTDFVIDTDVEIITPYVEELHTEEEIRKMKLRAVMTFWKEFDRKHPEYKWFSYVSGKGMYRVQRVNRPIDKTIFNDVIWDEILKECPKQKTARERRKIHKCTSKCKGFFKITKENSPIEKIKRGIGKIIEIDNVEYLIIIDTSLYKRGRHVYRLPYSPYVKFGYRTYYCVPVVYTNGEIDIEETIKRTEFNNIVVEEIEYPPYQFEKETFLKERERSTKLDLPNYIPTDVPKYTVNVPEPEDELTETQKRILKEMIEAVSSKDPDITPPCIRKAWENRHDHWMRIILVRYLASKRYDSFGGKGYTPDECALFIRFAVNDEEDNLPQNRNKIQLVAWAYGHPSRPNLPPHCDKMQDINGEFYCCSPKERKRCNRTYCMYPNPKFTIEKAEPIRKDDIKKSFGEITNLISEVIQQPHKNFELIKTTRAGVTTSLIRAATMHGKKMLAITPTNRIANDVFSEAMKLIYDIYGEKVEGAVLSSNMKACLKLRFTLLDLEKKKEEQNWKYIEWMNLMFHSKPSCSYFTKSGEKVSCEYYYETFEFPHRNGEYPYPISISQPDKQKYKLEGKKVGKCAYRTIMERVLDYDIVFITYDKLASLLYNVDKESREFIEVIYDNFDIVFMDEISKLVQSSPLTITMYEIDEEGNHATDFTYNLSQDINLLISKYFNPTTERITQLAEMFIDYYDPIIRKEILNNHIDTSKSYKISNFMDDTELYDYQQKFSAYYGVIDKYAKEHNIHLHYLEKMLVLLQNEEWWVQITPTPDYPISIVFTTTPKIDKTKEFVQTINKVYGKQIIATDATMPLAKISDILGVEFERFVVGDPRNTCDKQLIICDTKTIPAMYLRRNKEGAKYVENLVNFINNVCNAHGVNNVMLVLPNKRFIYKLIQKLKKAKKIPYHLEVTWYRSDKTVGVGTKKRVMIAACAPRPPIGSHLWLARYYHDEGLFLEEDAYTLSSRLEEMNMHQTFYQTIGRVKDPKAQEFSVVYCWGIGYSEVKKIIRMDEDVPIPHITKLSSSFGSSNLTNLDYIKIGKAWLRFGIILDDRFIRLHRYIEKNTKVDEDVLIRKLFLSKDYLAELKSIPELLTYFGIRYTVFTDKMSKKKSTVFHSLHKST